MDIDDFQVLGCRACATPGGGCQFLGTAATTQVVGEAMGLSLPHLASAATNDALRHPATAKNCIYIFLCGGPSQLEMWDPKPDAPDGIRVHLEDTGDEAVDVFVPYRRDEAGDVEYGEIVGQEAERRLISRRPS